jgi:serine/alanine adding enzyme
MKTALITRQWNEFLSRFPANLRDIYFTEQYLRLYEDALHTPECFVYEDSGNTFLFPYLKRNIKLLDSGYYDFETAYGYAGPIATVADDQFIRAAWGAFLNESRDRKLIAGFIRFHPLLANYKGMHKLLSVSFDRKTVAMDLCLPKERMLSEEIHSKHRNVIRKACDYGLRFVADEDFKNLDAFINIYNLTMDGMTADEFYYFKPAYYEAIKNNLKGNSFLGLVYDGEAIIAAAIFFYYGIYGHYHLAGSIKESQRCYPNNFLIYNAALYMQAKGVSQFHLGGGCRHGVEDSLYKFKRRFSQTEYEFYIGKLVIDQPVYDRVCRLWEEQFPGKKKKYGQYILKYSY